MPTVIILNNNQSLTTLRLLAASDSAALRTAEAEHLDFWTSQKLRWRGLEGEGVGGVRGHQVVGGTGKCAANAAT